jgi:hypothetical protein
MNLSIHPAQANSKLPREAILKVRPASLPRLRRSARLPGPGSGSSGEFIKKLTFQSRKHVALTSSEKI